MGGGGSRRGLIVLGHEREEGGSQREGERSMMSPWPRSVVVVLAGDGIE